MCKFLQPATRLLLPLPLASLVPGWAWHPPREQPGAVSWWRGPSKWWDFRESKSGSGIYIKGNELQVSWYRIDRLTCVYVIYCMHNIYIYLAYISYTSWGWTFPVSLRTVVFWRFFPNSWRRWGESWTKLVPSWTATYMSIKLQIMLFFFSQYYWNHRRIVLLQLELLLQQRYLSYIKRISI